VDGLESLAIQRQLVLATKNVEPLECAIEVVDDSGVVAVDVNFGFFRFDFEADRTFIRVIRVVGVGVGPEGVRESKPRIAIPEWAGVVGVIVRIRPSVIASDPDSNVAVPLSLSGSREPKGHEANRGEQDKSSFWGHGTHLAEQACKNARAIRVPGLLPGG
jgi:hypothetical protein